MNAQTQPDDLRRVIISKNTQGNSNQPKTSLSSRFGEISKVRKNTIYKSTPRSSGKARGASRISRSSNRMMIDEPSASRSTTSRRGRGKGRSRGRGRKIPMNVERLDKDLDRFMMKDPQVAKNRLDKNLEGYMMDVESAQGAEPSKTTKVK